MPDYTEIADPPRQCVIETMLGCELSCPSCFLGAGMISRKKGAMSWELFSKIADQIEPFVKHTYAHLWGEGTLNKNIGRMIRRLKEFATVDFATHGMNVTEEMAVDLVLADSLSVSIEGLDQETYEKYRVNGNLERAMNGMRILAKAKPGKVNWTWVVMNFNEHQIEQARVIAAEIGVNFGPKPPYFVDEKTKKELMPKSEKYKRYDAEGNLKANRLSCREFHETVYVLPDGRITTCCFDFDGVWPIGNINDMTILEAWNGPVMRDMRRNHLSGILNPLCQLNCGLP